MHELFELKNNTAHSKFLRDCALAKRHYNKSEVELFDEDPREFGQLLAEESAVEDGRR